jgi:hypothetical protein
MLDPADIFTTMINGFGSAYFVIALPIFAACGLFWLAIRRRIHAARTRRVLVSLLFAVAFAPSIFGFDFGAVTVPALFVIALALAGGLRFIALCWSVVSIAGLWAIIFASWSLISCCHAREKDIAA